MFDDDLFEALCGVSTTAMESTKEDDNVVVRDMLLKSELAVLDTNTSYIEDARKQLAAHGGEAAAVKTSRITAILDLAQLVCGGHYADVLRSERIAQLLQHLIALKASSSEDAHVCTAVSHVLEQMLVDENDDERLVLAYEMLLAGVAFLNIYVQANYTGPAFEAKDLSDINDVAARVIYGTSSNDSQKLHMDVLLALQVDGESPFNICEYPQLLLLARCLLHFVGNAAYSNWSVSVQEIGKDDELQALVGKNGLKNQQVLEVLAMIPSARWWNARACTAHERLLITREPSNTLWHEAKRGFLTVIQTQELFATKKTGEYLLARAHVEWGLAQNYFDKNKQGKRSFETAKDVSGLTVQLSGSLGKRTKFQQKSVAQMVLLAASKHAPEETVASQYAEAAADATHVEFGGRKEGEEATEVEAVDAEKIKGLVETGEATFRTINLDQVDPDNYLLEKISFDKDLTQQGNLQVIDQVILLALCLDVKNSNGNDGLTHDEMQPYITRVLANPNNWMVYSTGLLERAWLECESSKRRQRAVLQMQALVDQHTTRLTITQSSLKAIEDSAPAHERMAFVYSLAFPPRYALKRDLAERYFGLSVIGSAAELFRELEMWDDVVRCYQILDQPTKAENLVRERLEIAPTPYMWCSLGDITGDLSYYEKSWEFSKHRYARAKRSLGRHAFEHGDYPTAIAHYKECVEVNPMHTETWFTLGVMGMRMTDWKLALQSFTRVVQLEPDHGEAWGNIGSVHMKRGQFAEGFSVLQEALKQKRHMWQMWENFAICAVETERYGEAIYAMHQLLDMRHKHKRPVDHQMLAWLVEAIVFPEELKQQMQADAAGTGNNTNNTADESEAMSALGVFAAEEEEDLAELDEAAEAVDKAPPLSESQYKKQLALLFGRVTAIVTNHPRIWQVYARFNDGVGRPQKALDCRLKQCRALQTGGWDQDKAKVEELCRAAVRLAQDYQQQNTKKALYSCRLYIRGVLKKAQVDFADLDAVRELAATLDAVTAQEQQLPAP
ncbi:TPA: hypothetical protein N0F65_009358 [Lagenidium giganteum]|uniref:Uncharacterized protein n=1 Tax=Lagenidium giganteum TaxID=4803 RepID=A0AAV2ZCJ1_9STRA|nr:TPA: hypothetical protein N0F65_009358 [Lagenidium giganteum]